jgi:hypothetical protein
VIVVAVELEFMPPLVCLATTMSRLFVVLLAAANVLIGKIKVQQFKDQVFQNSQSQISTLSNTSTPKVQHRAKQAYRNSLEASYRFPRYKTENVILPETIAASI